MPERVSCSRIAGTPPHSTERYRLRQMQAATALNILLVDDDEALRETLKRSFEREGHRITAVADGHAALERAGGRAVRRRAARRRPRPAPVRPRRRRELRARREVVPIIMLTALDSEADVVQGLEAGRRRLRHEALRAGRAAQPHPRRAAPRARAASSRARVKVGPVVIDQRMRQVTVDGAAVRLTFSEFELLGCLMERPGRLFTRQELLRAIWGDSAYRDPRAIDVHIRHLREKLEATPEQPQLILTVRGAGYRFREP